MPKFSYIAKDKTGNTFQNVIEAQSKEDLAEKLQRQGYFVVSIE